MNLSRPRFLAGIPKRFIAVLCVAVAYVAFLVVDQSHWWQLKPDYAFGWLVPLFVIYMVADRWNKLAGLMRAQNPAELPRGLSWILRGVFAAALAGGMLLFLLGALYRAGSGISQPGSLVIAFGFPGVLLGMIYFNTPERSVASRGDGGLMAALHGSVRLRAVALFLFPALIWILSAPLLTVVENAISLALLRKVVAVVFTTFSVLGYPLVQEGNVLVLPHGTVGVADACSGIRSLTGCMFAGSFLASMFLDRFWKKVLLVVLAMGLAFLTNLLRSLFLTSWAYAYGSEAIEGQLHDITGYAVLGCTVAGLLVLLPWFSPRRDRAPPPGAAPGEDGVADVAAAPDR